MRLFRLKLSQSGPISYGKIFNIDNNHGTVSFGWLDTDFDQSLYVIQVFRENGTQGSKVRFRWKMRHLKSDEVAIRSMPSTVLYFQMRKNGMYFVTKIVLTYCEKKLFQFLKFEAEGREFATFQRSLDQFIQTVKGQTNF